MAELLSNLGINWKILIAQIVNFAILLFILKKFLYRPILDALNKRREEIKTATENAKSIDERLRAIEEAKEKVLSEAREESQKMIKRAEADAKASGERLITAAREAAAAVTREERQKLQLEREKLMQDIKQQVGATVALAIEKTIGDVLDERARTKLLEQALELVQKHKETTR